jgi:hypothetical protein
MASARPEVDRCKEIWSTGLLCNYLGCRETPLLQDTRDHFGNCTFVSRKIGAGRLDQCPCHLQQVSGSAHVTCLPRCVGYWSL